MIIKKRFGPKSFVSYLGLKDVYSVGPKPRKKQQVSTGYLYKPIPSERRAYDQQQATSSGHSGPWKKFYGGPKDLRAHKLTWTAKEPPPVYTSLDHLNEHWGRDRRGGILRQQAQQLILDEYNNRVDEARARFEHERGAQENARNAARAERRAGIRRGIRVAGRVAARRELEVRAQANRLLHMTANIKNIQRIQRWARKIAWREDWKKKLVEQGNMPIGVDRATVNYIRNMLMTMDDKSLKEWIRELATTQERFDTQNSDFLAWVKTNQAQSEAPETADASTDNNLLGFLGQMFASPSGKAPASALPKQTPDKTDTSKQLFHVDDGGGKDPLAAQQQHGGSPFEQDQIEAERVKTAEKKREKREASKKADERRISLLTKRLI